MKRVRAKFKCNTVKIDGDNVIVKLTPVYDKVDNKDDSVSVLTGSESDSAEFTFSNLLCGQMFDQDGEYYIEFIPANEEQYFIEYKTVSEIEAEKIILNEID